jgi:hypothetical protein
MTQKWIIFWGYKNKNDDKKKNDDKNSFNKQKNKHLFLNSKFKFKGFRTFEFKSINSKTQKVIHFEFKLT